MDRDEEHPMTMKAAGKVAAVLRCSECGSEDVHEHRDGAVECNACGAIESRGTVWANRDEYEWWLERGGDHEASRRTASKVAWTVSPEDPDVWLSEVVNGLVGIVEATEEARTADYDLPTRGWLWSVEEDQSGRVVATGFSDIEFVARREAEQALQGRRTAARPGDTRRGRSALLGASVVFQDGRTGKIMDLAPITNPDGPTRTERTMTNYDWRKPKFRSVEVPTQKAVHPDYRAAEIEACWVASEGEVYWASVHVPTMRVLDHHQTSQQVAASLRRRTALGETKAPAEVDTLRDDACPVCGSVDFRGEVCNSCGYVKPPVIFHDPDTQTARDVDLRERAVPVDLACDNCGAVYPATSGEGVGTTKTSAVDPDDIPDPDEDDAQEARKAAEPQEDFVPSDQDAETGPDEQPDGSPSHEPEQGDLCPSCGIGTLTPKDEIEGIESEDLSDSTEEDEEEMEDPERAAAADPTMKESLMSTTTTRGETPEFDPRHLDALNSRLAATNRLLRRQAKVTDALADRQRTVARQNSVLAHENRLLRSALLSLGDAVGEKGLAATASLRPRTASDAPTTDAAAAAPEARDDVTTPGAAPAAANDDVTPDATTEVESRDVALDESTAVNELVDVTETHTVPGDGTTHTVPQPSATPTGEVANPIQESGWTTAAKDGTDRPSQFAAMRLAQLRLQTGTETGDEIVNAQKIASTMSALEVEHEVTTLGRVLEARKTASRPAPRGLVPRSAQQPPTLTSSASVEAEGDADNPGVQIEDSFF